MAVLKSTVTPRIPTAGGDPFYIPQGLVSSSASPFPPTVTVGGFVAQNVAVYLPAIAAGSTVYGTQQVSVALPKVSLPVNSTGTILFSLCLASQPLPNTIIGMPQVSLAYPGSTVAQPTTGTTGVFTLNSQTPATIPNMTIRLTATGGAAIAAQTVQVGVWALLLGQVTNET